MKLIVTRLESNLLWSCLKSYKIIKIAVMTLQAALKVKCSDESCCCDRGYIISVHEKRGVCGMCW